MIVIYGDVPLITAEAITALAAAHEASGAAATMATMELDDPASYGRVLRAADGSVEGVVEAKRRGRDGGRSWRSARSTRACTRSTAARWWTRWSRLEPANAQGEYYLPDVLPLMRAAGPHDRRARRSPTRR